MMKPALLVAIALVVGGWGIHGPKGNDTGGIIPWSPEAEASARAFANDNCGAYNKYAVITSMRRRYGDYIVYEFRFFRHDPAGVVLTSRG